MLISRESFFARRVYHRLQDCFARPLCSAPGVYIDIMERLSNDNNCTLFLTGKYKRCLNLGSYNYLGFADDWQATCKDEVLKATITWPNSLCSSRMDMGSTVLHENLEQCVADYVGKEASIVYSMGYATNAGTIPSLMGPGTLVVSDSLNHTSLVNGARGSSSMIRVFRNNDIQHLEDILCEAIFKGQPHHHRPWKKIMVIIEGIYSMEGTICKLKEIVGVCKKYKAYIYLDEAHSIGALGYNGRGICEHAGVNPSDIDIMMGTFTKSFGAMGGYIAASKEIINHIKSTSSGLLLHSSISCIVAQQIMTSLNIITGRDGTTIGRNKLDALVNNSNYFRSGLKKLGLEVIGDYDSPIIPIMIYCPAKLCSFSRECLKRGVAVVVVGFPATPLLLSRARFCISASHSKNDLDYAIEVIDELATLFCLKYANSFIGC